MMHTATMAKHRAPKKRSPRDPAWVSVLRYTPPFLLGVALSCMYLFQHALTFATMDR